MEDNMDPSENDPMTDDSNSALQLNPSEEAESAGRPSLSQVRKSWGFRRTTIARREFLDEVGQLAHSPPPVRKTRTRRSNQITQATQQTCISERATPTARSVLEDLEWSAPSSPASEDSKPATDAPSGGCFDPSLWQDFGSAFHTAFSLLGGNEGLSLEMSDALAVPHVLEATDTIEVHPPQDVGETETPDNLESPADLEILQPESPGIVAREENDDVVLISSQEGGGDEMTLLQIKEQQDSKGGQGNVRTRGGKGGRGRAKGKGRGRRRGKRKGKGRGRAVDLTSSIADEDSNDDVILVGPVEQQSEEGNVNYLQSAASACEMSPAQRSSSDCIYIESDLGQVTDLTTGQYDDAPEELGKDVKDDINEGDDKIKGECSGVSETKLYDSNTLCCVCQQKHNERFMILCDSCQKWLHGNCVGISEVQGNEMARSGHEYICPLCTTENQSQQHPNPEPRSEPPEPSIPECLTQNSSVEEDESQEDLQAVKEPVIVVEEVENEEANAIKPKPEAEMEADNSSHCIGPSCSKKALPGSVYCGSDCILHHAAFTMKTLSVPDMPKSKKRAQNKAAAASPTAKGQRSVRTSKRLSAKAVVGEQKEVKEDDGGQEETAFPLACNPSLTEVEAASPPSSQFYTASDVDNNNESVADPLKTPPEESSTDTSSSSQPVAEPDLSQNQPQGKPKPAQQLAEANSPQSETPSQALATPSTSASAARHHETGAIMVTKTGYVIPKKQSVSQAQVPASASSQKPPSALTLLNETRNLLVPPAPSAPSSRPSQPNNQVRQSIQRSLSSILFKRVSDCDDLDTTESEVTKLVANIEMEMFDIFRNTDSKYMNKYRTIMFNLKDPKNKGLLCRVIHGEISPFRLARMSQKDMQATKVSEPSAKETTETKCQDTAAKVTSLQQKPEEVKIDLPSLNPPKQESSTEQKKSLPPPASKARPRQTSHTIAPPDSLICMLKDTTSEHKTHLFDVKCKICTGQIVPVNEEEPTKKKPRVSETRDRYEPSWKKSTRDDSPLRAPPDSPDMDSPTSSLMDSSSHLAIDSPVLTIVESPASPPMDSPASPTLESPASPVMESPASPPQDTTTAAATKRAYRPVVIPVVSTVTITRRDPRTAASRFSAPPSGHPSHSITTYNQSVTYAPLNENILAPPSAPVFSQPPKKPLPKSILMKPSPTVDPRLYGISSRTVISESPADDETSQFLAKQDILWKGFLNMPTVTKFVTKAYRVSGSTENIKLDLPDTIQIGGRILPETVWDYVSKLKTSVTKELCVIRFHPATEEEEVAYVSLFSYFSSRGRFGVVANSSRSIKDLYLVPLGAKESIPSILQPLGAPGLEQKRPNILLGLAIVQKVKRPGILPQEIEENRPKVHMSKDPMWIPKPPVLYGSDKLEIFQPYDPMTPATTTPPSSPPCPGSPSESSSCDSVTIPSILNSIRTKPPVSTSATVAATQPTFQNLSDKSPTTSSEDMPLQTILRSLFGKKQTDSVTSSDNSSTTSTVTGKKLPVFPQVSGPMVDPIVQQYGQKSKIKEIEEENDLDRPYDPEEEYGPTGTYGTVPPQSSEKKKADGSSVSGWDDDVAYDPEDETIFADIQNNAVKKPPILPEISDSSSCTSSVSIQAIVPASSSSPVQTSSPAGVKQDLPTGTVVVSAATLTEQQRMLEELNKQIEEQKRQLKMQEEALRQQREAVGMFMAQFTASDSLKSPAQKTLPLSQFSSLQSGTLHTESRALESADSANNLSNTVDGSYLDSQTITLEDTTAIPNIKNDEAAVTEQDETQEIKDNDKYSSAGEIQDSDVAYDPEDESLFNEIQEDVFQGGAVKTRDSSLTRTGRGVSHKETQNSHRSRKRRLSPKRRSHRERDRNRSPSRKSQRRSPSRRRREKERHRRSEGDRSRHRAKDQSDRQSRHRKDHTGRRHSHHGHRRSPSSLGKTDSASHSSRQYGRHSPKFFDGSSITVTFKNDPDGHESESTCVENLDKDCSSHESISIVKLENSEVPASEELQNNAVRDLESRGRSFSTQGNNLSQLETQNDKIVSTVPLREIEPPIRDSPQSPDPEPQFVKPCSIEKSDCEKADLIRGLALCTNVSMPLDKVENSCLPIDSQKMISSVNQSTTGGPITNIGNMDFISLDLGVRDQVVTEPNKHFEGKSPSINQMQGRCEGHSNLTTSSHFQVSGLEIDAVTTTPELGRNILGIMTPDMVPPGHWGPEMNLKESKGGFPGPDSGVTGKNTSIFLFGPPKIDQATSGQESFARGIGTEKQSTEISMSNPGTQDHNTARISSEPVMKISGMRSPSQHMESTCMQDMNPKMKCQGSDVKCSNEEMKEQMILPVVWNLHMGKLGPQIGKSELVMNTPFLGGPGHHRSDTGSSEPLSTCSTRDKPSPDKVMQAVVDEMRSQDVSCLQKSLLCLKTEAKNPNGKPGVLEMERDQSSRGQQIAHSAQGQKDGNENPHIGGMKKDTSIKDLRSDIRSPDPSFMGSARVNSQDVVQVVDETETEKRDANLDLNKVGVCRETSLHSNTSTGSEATVLRTDSLYPDVSDGRQEHQRGTAVPIVVPAQTINKESGVPHISFIEQDSDGPKEHLLNQTHDQGSHTIDSNWSSPVLDTENDSRDLDKRRAGPVRGGQFNQAVHPHGRSSNMENMTNNRRQLGTQDFMVPGPERRGSDMEVPMHDKRGLGVPHFREPEPERKDPTTDSQRPIRKGPGGQDFIELGFEKKGIPFEGPNQSRPRGPHVRGPWPERRTPNMEGYTNDWQRPGGSDFSGPEPDERGSGGPDFRGPQAHRICLSMDGPEPFRRGPGPENNTLTMEHHVPIQKGPGRPDIRESGQQNSNLSMENLGSHNRGPGGQEFSGPGSFRRVVLKDGPRPFWKGPVDPDFNAAGPDREDPAMSGPAPGRRVPGGSDFSGLDRQGPTVAGPGPDRRVRGGLDCRGPGADGRSPVTCGPQLDRMVIRGSDYRGQRLERSGPITERTDRIGLGSTDLDGPGPNRRGQRMESLRPERREYSSSDFIVPDHERNACTIDNQEPNMEETIGLHFQGNRPKRGPHNIGPGNQDLRGPASDWRCSTLQDQGPDRRERGPYIRGPRPDFFELEPEQTGPGMEGPGQEIRGQRGHHFKGSAREAGYSDMDKSRGPDSESPDFCIAGPVLTRRGPRGPNMIRPILQHSENPLHEMRGPVRGNFRGPAPQRRPREMERIDYSRNFPGGTQFRGHVPRLNSQDPHFRGPNNQNGAPENFRPETDRRRPGGPGPGIRETGSNIDNQRYRRDNWGEDAFAGTESIQESLDIADRKVQSFRGPGHMRRNIRGAGPLMSNLNPTGRWEGSDFRDSTPDRRGIQTDEWSEETGQNLEAIENEIDDEQNHWERNCFRGPENIQDGQDDQVQEYSRRGPPMEWRGHRDPKHIDDRPKYPVPLKAPGDNWSSHCRGPGLLRNDLDMVGPRHSRDESKEEWRDPDRGHVGPNRSGPGQFSRGLRDQNNRGQVYNTNSTEVKGPGLDISGGPERGPCMGEPNTKWPGVPRRGGPEFMNRCPNRRRYEMEVFDRGGSRGSELSSLGPENRNPSCEGPAMSDGRFSDSGDLESEGQDVSLENLTDGQGFCDFRKERRGPGPRRPWPDKTHTRDMTSESLDVPHGHGRWDPNIESPGLDSRRSEPVLLNRPYHGDRLRGPNRGALLPTPTQGIKRFSNQTMNNPDVSQRKRISLSTDRPWSRGRPLHRETDLGQRPRESSLAAKIRSPADACIADCGEHKETDE